MISTDSDNALKIFALAGCGWIFW